MTTQQDLDPQTAEPSGSHRARWAAIGAAVAVTLGAGGLMTATAVQNSGEKSTFVAITPCRVMDTRPAPRTVGSRSTPLGPAETHTIQITGQNGSCELPADANAVTMNVTVVDPTADSFLTVWPADAPQPVASNLNYVNGQQPTPNAVTVDLSAVGKVSFFNNGGNANVVADIVGYYVDHNHDDRYYAKELVDAHEATQKYITIDLLSAFTNATVDDDVDDWGLRFTEATGKSVTMHVVAPPDLTPGTAMKLRVFYRIAQTGCTVALTPVKLFTGGVGETFTTSPESEFAGFEVVGTDPAAAPSPINTLGVRQYMITSPDDPAGLEPGDTIAFRLHREGAADTCTQDLFLVSAEIIYS